MNIVVIPPWGEPQTEEYAEEHWLPKIGPTAFLLMRKLLRMHGERLDGDTLSTSLGIGAQVLAKAIHRLSAFDLLVVADAVVVRPWPLIKSHDWAATKRRLHAEVLSDA